MVLGLESSVIHPIWWTNREKKQVIYLYVDWKIYTNSSKSNQNVLIDRNSAVIWVGHLQNKLLNMGNNQPTIRQTYRNVLYTKVAKLIYLLLKVGIMWVERKQNYYRCIKTMVLYMFNIIIVLNPKISVSFPY